MEWTKAVNNNGSLLKAAKMLMHLLNADALLVVRASKNERKIKHIARCCIQQGKIWPSQPQTQAELIFGAIISTAKQGSVWKLTDTMLSGTEPKSRYEYHKPEGLVEVIVIPLEKYETHIDFIELHYSVSPLCSDLDLLAILTSTLSNGWRNRLPGMISARTERPRSHRLVGGSGDENVPILDPQNPAALSRSEFRVCAMLREGMTVKFISENLSVGPATVRSHLSSIFSKTGASNQVELLHLLNRTFEARGGSCQKNIA
ncbi:helix-turn-helix transcriptional regulator [Ruegeria sp. HKCCD4318-2]|nr:helix-turn-helix transcriptional regulator [Ruegeria sp. HKCCD4318-2]